MANRADGACHAFILFSIRLIHRHNHFKIPVIGFTKVPEQTFSSISEDSRFLSYKIACECASHNNRPVIRCMHSSSGCKSDTNKLIDTPWLLSAEVLKLKRDRERLVMLSHRQSRLTQIAIITKYTKSVAMIKFYGDKRVRPARPGCVGKQ